MVTATPTFEPEPLGVIDGGLNEHTAPGGIFPQLKLTAWSNPPVAVRVTSAVAVPPGSVINDVGETLIVKPLPLAAALLEKNTSRPPPTLADHAIRAPPTESLIICTADGED